MEKNVDNPHAGGTKGIGGSRSFGMFWELPQSIMKMIYNDFIRI